MTLLVTAIRKYVLGITLIFRNRASKNKIHFRESAMWPLGMYVSGRKVEAHKTRNVVPQMLQSSPSSSLFSNFQSQILTLNDSWMFDAVAHSLPSHCSNIRVRNDLILDPRQRMLQPIVLCMLF